MNGSRPPASRLVEVPVEIGREWISADLILGNLPDTPVTSTSTSLDLAGWDARIYSADPRQPTP
jgi:hypothetical protein